MANILLVDDSRDLLDALRLLLEMEKQIVKTAANAAAALALLETDFVPDLIVCDYGLPDMNGIELLKQIRVHPIHKQIRFILTSGRRDVIMEAKSAGANDFLDKPFPMHDFLKMVVPHP